MTGPEAIPPEAAGNLLMSLGVMLGAALLFVTLFRKLGLGATLGYIVGGAVIGPQALRLIDDPASVMNLTEIGIALLLFIVGLELDPARLWRLRKDIFGLGLAQVVVCGLALSGVLHFALGFSWEASLALGLPLGLSSTAQVLPMLRSSGDLHRREGERAFSVLLFQDLSIVPLITIIAAMSRAPAAEDTPGGMMLAVSTVGAIVGLMLVGRFVLNPLFRLIGRVGERELFVVASLFTVVASAALMHWLHLSPALGAFVAGVMLAESPYRHELESDVEPFRSLLLGLFFLSVGMLLDLSAIAERPGFVVALALAVVAVKAGVITLLARIAKLEWRASLKLGLLLSQAGEFGFVLFSQATEARLILPEAASLFGAVVTLSMATTPLLMRLIDWLDRRTQADEEGGEGPDRAPRGGAIVVGHGRFGQSVSQMLMARRLPVALIDKKPAQIELSDQFSIKVFYGDGTRLDLLRSAGADEAQAILFCIDEPIERERLAAVLDAFPQAVVMVRAFDRLTVMELDGLDLALVQREVFESAVTMGRAALKALGVGAAEIDRIERSYRDRDCDRLERQSRTRDLHAGEERIFRAVEPGEEPA